MGLLCFATEFLIGQIITCAEGNNWLQPKAGAARDPICEYGVNQGYIGNKVALTIYGKMEKPNKHTFYEHSLKNVSIENV